MPYSHRDLRADREVRRLVGVVGASAVALGAVAYLVPTPVVGALAVLGLAGLGVWAMARGARLVAEYTDDLRHVSTVPIDRLGSRGVEVRSVVALGDAPTSPVRRSPHVRSPARRAPGESPGPVTTPG